MRSKLQTTNEKEFLEAVKDMKPIVGVNGINEQYNQIFISPDAKRMIQIKYLDYYNETITWFYCTIDNDCSYNHNGYKLVKAAGKVFLLHRAIACTFCENPNGYKEVNHKDGNKKNNCASNLEWVTRSMNVKHAWDNGLIKKPVKKLKLNIKYK